MTGPLTRLDETNVDDEIQSWYYDVAKDIDIQKGDIDLEWYELTADDVSGVALYE